MQKQSSVRRRFAGARWFFLVWLMLVGLVLPATAKTSVDFDPDVDFSKFKTFAFIGPVENLVMIQLNPDLINTRMHDMVARELQKKGLREVSANQSPDLVVRYWAIPESQVNVAVMGNWAPYGAYIDGRWSNVYNSVPTSNRRESTLILDLIQARSKSLAWRIYLIRKFSEPEKDWKKAEEEFTEGFKSYPPSDKMRADKRRENTKG